MADGFLRKLEAIFEEANRFMGKLRCWESLNVMSMEIQMVECSKDEKDRV